MISAVIYDMDGLLVDSEPWWRVAETNVFGRLSKAPSPEDFEKMMGNRIQEVILHWHNAHPWENFSLEETLDEIVTEVESLVKANAQLLPGVKKSLHFFRNREIPIALASSSPMKLIRNLMDYFGILDEFDLIHSAEKEEYGKPHPAVFLSTADELETNPANCLVFEDSFNGLIAAKAAKMKCIIVPAGEHFAQTRFDIADMKLRSLEEFNEQCWEQLNDK